MTSQDQNKHLQAPETPVSDIEVLDVHAEKYSVTSSYREKSGQPLHLFDPALSDADLRAHEVVMGRTQDGMSLDMPHKRLCASTK